MSAKPSKPNIVCLGGGTGTFVVLSGLKKFVRPTAIVSMADSGGSTGRLRDEFGVLPPGDVRQALVALAPQNGDRTLRKLFSHRFNHPGSLHGHNFGNILLTALTSILGNEALAIEKAGEILNIHGQVLPVTLDNTNLIATYSNGRQLVGEKFIDQSNRIDERIIKLQLLPEAQLYSPAAAAISKADSIVIGPGDLYTSLLPNLLVKGIAEALKKSRAKLIYIVNLITRPGQTHGLSAADHTLILERYLPRPADMVLYNQAPIPREALERYKTEETGLPVRDDLDRLTDAVKIIRGDFLSKHLEEAVSGDATERSLIRHDPDKLATVLLKLV